MRYLPSIGFGFTLIFLLVYSIGLSSSYSPFVDYFFSNPALSANSSEWLLLMLHDSVISLFLTAIIVFIYYKFLPKYPFNLLAITLMQLPVTFVFMSINGMPSRFESTYESAASIATLVASSSVLLVFIVIIAYNKMLNWSG